ncbi:hypothetical protein [Methylobacterium sp. ID0610]|uniref:hypothetical protein n=1 Tax=Methylobacterium carpenticola TaxID=3344827 RepID=UPI00369F981F
MSARLNRGLFSYFVHGAESALVTLPIPFDDDGDGADLADLVRGTSAPAEVIPGMIATVMRVHADTQRQPGAAKRKIMLGVWLRVLSELAKCDHMLAVAGSLEHGPYLMMASTQVRTDTTDEEFEAELPEMVQWLTAQFEKQYGGAE